MENNEQWKPVRQSGNAHEVSNLGRVRRTSNRKILKTARHKQGYRLVTLSFLKTKWQGTVHSLVAEYFIGPRPAGMVICHIDDNPANNNVTNLKYATQKENMHDAIKTGIWKPWGDYAAYGEAHHRTVLTEAQVSEMRTLFKAGVKAKDLALHFGAPRSTIYNIVTGRRWTHVD